MLFYLEETFLDLELARQSYQWILQAVSHTIDLLSIQIEKYESKKCKYNCKNFHQIDHLICCGKIDISVAADWNVDIGNLKELGDIEENTNHCHWN